MPLLEHFDLLAPLYDRAMRLLDPQMLIDLAGLPVTGMILDVGGGTGRVAQALKGLAAERVVADLSLGMLRQAQAKDGLHTVCAFSEKLPFPADVFERVIMVDAMHHVCNQAETAREMWRVVKPGGRIVIEEPDIRSPVVWVVAIVEKLALMRSHFISPQRIEALFPYSSARVCIQKRGYTSWVIVEKRPI